MVKNWNCINQKLVNLKGWIVIFFVFMMHVASASYAQLFLEQSYEYMTLCGWVPINFYGNLNSNFI